MRRGLSLIELIFTIVIIAIVFTVIPKVVLSLNKADSFAIRQDALFNGVSMVSMISKLPWDEANTNSSDILHVNSVNFICNTTTFRRVGGFIGSRNCEQNLTASLGSDGEITYDSYNDFDDFINENNISVEPYRLETKVVYLNDNFTRDGTKITFDLSNESETNSSTSLKKLDITVYYAGKRGDNRQLTQFSYISSNIGQIILNKRSW
jgi:prepilin-type N-terminal cleavage/methylation domain-containing protein